MITKIEIDGFKSFHNFRVNLRPFQVLIGANGVGKSNLFDAIVLLSNLAGNHTLYEAFRQNRGDLSELFTIYPDGERASQMCFAVEMLIGQEVVDTLGVSAEVSSNRLRYELHIERRQENGFERLYVIYERLSAVIEDNDDWYKNIPFPKRKFWIKRGRRAPYISTEQNKIWKHQDGRSGGKQETPLGRIERTLLSTITSAEYPTAYAARQEMLNWRFLQFNPLALRMPCEVYAPTELLPDGSNLAAVLYRMSREDEFALTDVSRDMANLVPGIQQITVSPLREREEFLIVAQTQDNSVFSSRVLSDGTLRLLALVVLKHDPHYQGVLCFEEPENGVHPERLKSVITVLKSLATDFTSEDETDRIPKQVLINTHAPRLIASKVRVEDLLFVYMMGGDLRETQMTPLSPQMFDDQPSPAIQKFTLHQVIQYLDPVSETEQRNELQGMMNSL